MTLSTDVSDYPSEKSRGVAFALAALLGPFGAHRFYLGKTGTGLLMLCTLGGVGPLVSLRSYSRGQWIVPAISTAALSPDGTPRSPARSDALPAEVLEELSALRSEVAELAERLDFAERILANPRPAEDQPSSTLRT